MPATTAWTLATLCFIAGAIMGTGVFGPIFWSLQ